MNDVGSLQKACVDRVQNMNKWTDKDLREKCELNGVATIDFKKVRLHPIVGESSGLRRHRSNLCHARR